jgi:hypothetical protein
MRQIFISYAREDEGTASALAEQLNQLKSLGIAETWIDRTIGLGESWEAAITQAAERADVILLLVSPAYLAGGFAHDRELGLLQDAGAQGARVIPVIVGECSWQAHPYIGSLQAFASGEVLRKPTTITFGRQAARLVEELRTLLEETAAGASDEQPNTAPEPADALAASTGRVDADGLAFKGSQVQTQLYVNVRPQALNRAILEAATSIPAGADIEWRSPLREDGYAEYRDAEFLGALGLERYGDSLKAYWPARGPRWDALARVTDPALPNGVGVILAEGKSYPEEMKSSCRAKGRSREQIGAAVATAQEALGAEVDPEPWLASHYQLANRLAHVVWLREQGIAAWLVHLLFVDDPHRPTTREAWTRALAEVRSELGIPDSSISVEVLLPALERSLLE